MFKLSVLIWTSLIVAVLFVSSLAAESSSPPQAETDLQYAQGLLDRPLSERGATWRCQPVHSFQCSKEGCKEIRPTVWIDVDFVALQYKRCDTKGCDSYPITYTTSGIYTTIALPNSHSTFLKAVNDGTEFVDVASLGTATYNNFGGCVLR